MLNFPPIQSALSPGQSLVLWQSRVLERSRPLLPIIEILPNDRGETGLNLCQGKGFLAYDFLGRKVFLPKKGEQLDIYC